MKKSIIVTLTLYVTVLINFAHSQNTVLYTSAFDMGFAIANSPTTQSKFSIGEPLSGFATGSSFAISSGFVADSVVQSHLTGVENTDGTLPLVYALKQNYPNPFNPTTTIAYELPKRSTVTIAIFNILGQLVTTLVDEEKGSGKFSVVWNGRSSVGVQVATGVYFCRIQAKSLDDGASFVETKKLILLK